MSTRSNTPARMWLGFAAGLVAILTLFAALHPRDPSTAWGALCGGGLVLLVFTVARRIKRGDNALVRGARGESDERDALILTKAGACVGLASPLAVGAAMVAVVWDVTPLTALGGIAWVNLVVFVAAYWWLRRHS
ncbi:MULTISPECIES: hypothetical protein [unclassified Luteococcus]|uniref:hypothetical protein n=1 Tax=unclassified Luteococcus TaxID=2639923 RepID=UPI00313B0267